VSLAWRIAVTGIGVVTPIGTGRRQFWEGLLAGKSGFAPVESFDTGRHSVHLGAEVRGFRGEPWVRRLDPGYLGRASQMAIAAAHLALADAGLAEGSVDPERAGVSMGTTSGEPREIEKYDDRHLAGTLDGLGPELGFEGQVTMIPAACAAGNYAIAHAVDVLRTGRVEVMLAGGADAFSRITYTGFARLGAIATDTVRPFDKNRKGMIPGEGAGVLVLEPLERALARGARVYAEVAGYGLSCDAHHMTAAHPEGAGAARAMAQALAESGLRPEQVSYVSAHGTGTPTNDRLETIAVKRVFGEAAYRVPISSIKSMIGHTMGAASAIEAAVCALAVWEDVVPPTMNLEEADPECDLDYVANAPRRMRVESAMNNAYAFGGNNASLILTKCGECGREAAA
jgi:3-oxoacyl-[acyl-carrier-protein] synthase II